MALQTIPIKVFFLCDGGRKSYQVKRFGISKKIEYYGFRALLVEAFPKLSGKPFSVFWKDEEDDEIDISDDNEMSIALTEGNSDLKKFYVRMNDEQSKNSSNEYNGEIHPMISCDVCESYVSGFRYKCIVCSDYDLCSNCEEMELHSEHPMLRIPSPHMFSRNALEKVISYVSHKMGETHEKWHHHGRKHSHNNEEHYRKRKYDKHESNPVDDDSDDVYHSKHHGKWGKRGRCVYSQIMNDFMKAWDSAQFTYDVNSKPKQSEKKNGEPPEQSSHIQYLKTIGKTISTFLDPFGVDVDVEIRSKNDEKEGKEEKKEDENKKETSPSSGGGSSKEIHLSNSADSVKEKVEEITKKLSEQNFSESPEEKDWVSFEELKRTATLSESGSVVETNPKHQGATPSNSNPLPGTSSAKPSTQPQGQKIYPDLSTTEYDFLLNKVLDDILSMGFENNDDRLAQLVKSKINEYRTKMDS